MELTAEQIVANWEEILSRIETYFDGERKDNLLEMYEFFGERMMFAPASQKDYYHNAFPGGYIDHSLHVDIIAYKTMKLWNHVNAEMDFSEEELHFAALHHDLGKVGDKEHDYYVINDSDWHRKNRGDIFKFNPNIQYMSVPDRSLFLLSQFGIKLSQTEFLGIKLHDGMFDDENARYYKAWNSEHILETNLPYIIHHADMLATRQEFQTWYYKRGGKEILEDRHGSAEQLSTQFGTSKSQEKESEGFNSDVFNELFEQD